LVAALLRVARVTAGLAENNGSLLSGLWLTSPAGWLPRTGISSGTLRSAIEFGLPLPFYTEWQWRHRVYGLDQSCLAHKRTLKVCSRVPNLALIDQERWVHDPPNVKIRQICSFPPSVCVSMHQAEWNLACKHRPGVCCRLPNLDLVEQC